MSRGTTARTMVPLLAAVLIALAVFAHNAPLRIRTYEP